MGGHPPLKMRPFNEIITLPLSVLTCSEISAVACTFGAVYVEAALGKEVAVRWRDTMAMQFAAAIEAGTVAGLTADSPVNEPPNWYKHLSAPDPED